MTKGRKQRGLPGELITALRSAEHIVVLTGSGISAESGVPTFREAQTGLWSKFDPQSLATPEAFNHDPRLVWDWYRWRRGLNKNAKPNSGHLALVDMERQVPRLSLVTQNVDGLHRRAGSSGVIELHGDIMRSRCTKEGTLVENPDLTSDDLPRCHRCGSLLRPHVVWFGEQLHQGAYQEALEASRDCDLFIAVGTSGVVQPAASLAIEARSYGAVFVEINIESTPLTLYADFTLLGTAGNVLPSLVSETFKS